MSRLQWHCNKIREVKLARSKRKFTLARLDDRFGGTSEASEEEGKGMEELAGASSEVPGSLPELLLPYLRETP